MPFITAARGESRLAHNFPADIVRRPRTPANVFGRSDRFQVTPACLTDRPTSPNGSTGQIATANFFDVLGVKPLHGHTFTPANDARKRRPSGGGVERDLLAQAFQWEIPPSSAGSSGSTSIPSPSSESCRHLPRHDERPALRFWAPVSMHGEVANFGSLQYREYRWLHTQSGCNRG